MLFRLTADKQSSQDTTVRARNPAAGGDPKSFVKGSRALRFWDRVS